MNDSQIPAYDPETLIDAYLDELLTSEQGAALNAWVKQDPANARRFAKATWLHRQVYDRLHVHDLQQIQDVAAPADGLDGLERLHAGDSGAVLAKLLELEQGADDSGIVDLTEELKRRDLERKRRASASAPAVRRGAHRGGVETARVLVIPKVLAYGSIAAVVLGLLSVVYVVGWGNRPAVNETVVETPPAEVVPDPGVDVPALPPVVAELVRGEGLVWADRSQSTLPGTALRRGFVVLEQGIAQVRFQSGAVATFRAPAVIELRGDNRMALNQGVMVANVPEEAYGFTVDTPTMRVVDLGTEFGVTAEETGDSTVQVFVGEVTAAALDTAGHLGTAISLKSRTGVAVDAQTRAGRDIEVDGRAFADLAPHVALLHRNLVVNGDFEQGEPGTVTGEGYWDVQNLAVPGWEDTGPGTVVAYDAAARHEYPDPATDVVPEGRGRSFYAGMGQGAIRQRIDVSALAGLTASETVAYDLSAWLGGYTDQNEYLLLTAHFLDARGRPVAEPVGLGVVHVYDRSGETGFVHRQERGTLPAGTHTIQIVVETIGDQNPPYVQDGYADNIKLVLSVE